MQPRVSVVVPTYNSAWSVGRTLLSVLHQTIADFEVIVINDGSTDDFAAAVAPYCGDPRVRIVEQANLGLATARNRGISEARAPLIAPIDADDMWHPEFLEATVDALDKNPEAPFAFTYHFRMDEQDFLFPWLPPPRPPRHDFIGLLSRNSVACGSAGVYRRAPMQQCGGYDESLGRRGMWGAEDWKLILRLARLGQPKLIERPLVGYRFVKSGMSQHDPQRQFRAVLAVITEIGEEAPEAPRRILADARTMMTGWLLPAFFRRGALKMFLREAMHAYVLNPLWFLNPVLRQGHIQRLRGYWRRFKRKLGGERRLHLSEAVFDGKRPFEYLPKT